MAQRLMRRQMVAGLLLGLALVAPLAARAEEPGGARAPRLEDGGPAAPGEGTGDARRLPRTVAVCQDRAAGRCWLARTAPECGAAPAEPFRVVIDQPGRPDVADALAACRDAVRQ